MTEEVFLKYSRSASDRATWNLPCKFFSSSWSVAVEGGFGLWVLPAAAISLSLPHAWVQLYSCSVSGCSAGPSLASGHFHLCVHAHVCCWPALRLGRTAATHSSSMSARASALPCPPSARQLSWWPLKPPLQVLSPSGELSSNPRLLRHCLLQQHIVSAFTLPLSTFKEQWCTASQLLPSGGDGCANCM